MKTTTNPKHRVWLIGGYELTTSELRDLVNYAIRKGWIKFTCLISPDDAMDYAAAARLGPGLVKRAVKSGWVKLPKSAPKSPPPPRLPARRAAKPMCACPSATAFTRPTTTIPSASATAAITRVPASAAPIPNCHE